VKQAQEVSDWYAAHPNGGPYPGDIVLAPMVEFSNASDATLSPEDAAHLQDLRTVISEQYEALFQ